MQIKGEDPASDYLSVPIGFLIELASSTTQQDIFQAFARWISVVMDTERATVALPDGNGGLKVLAIQGNEAISTGVSVPIDGTMIGRVFRNRRSEICFDLAASSHLGDCAKLSAAGLAACIDAPLVIGDRCFGVLAIGFGDASLASDERLLILESMAGCLASSMLLHEQLQTLSDLSVRDPLTKAYNRRFFQQYAGKAWERWQAANTGFSLAVVDLDHFKSINDTYGHEFGDDVLCGVADTMRRASRADDVVVRMGGEEFCLVFPETCLKSASELAEEIRQSIQKTVFWHDGTQVPVTASIGVAATNPHQDSVRALTMMADEALYRAKRNGRNCIASAQPN
ncbi:MAG: sensor domain-containing diguanylate cyclase [Pseudomonadota bacterium]